MIDYKRKLIIYYFILKISIGVEVTIALVSRTRFGMGEGVLHVL